MKLVELLARELKKWPIGTVSMTQDDDGAVNMYDHAFPTTLDTKCTWRCIGFTEYLARLKEVASDQQTAIVTIAQWQAERDRQKGGEWKRHRGNSQPVDEGTWVEVKLRCGDIQQGLANAFLWRHADCDVAANIMKYRVISQPQAEEVEVKDTTIGTLSYKVEIDTTEAAQTIDELAAKWDQIETPFKWRDEVTELNAYIEKYTRERDALIERLASEGFALIPPVVSVVSEFSGAGMIFPIEEWQIGDIVQVVSVSDESAAPLGVFKITDIDASEPKYELDKQYFPNHAQMKFVHRP